jgi:hypothetical protein
MIQRIQSLYLILTTLLSVLFLKGSYLTFFKESGSIISISLNGLFHGVQGKGEEAISGSLPLYLLIIIIILISIVTLLSFRNRNIQLWLSKSLIVDISILIIISVIYSLLIVKQYNATLIPGIKMLIPAAQLILSILAYRGIKKDVDLIKSYDRLR